MYRVLIRAETARSAELLPVAVASFGLSAAVSYWLFACGLLFGAWPAASSGPFGCGSLFGFLLQLVVRLFGCSKLFGFLAAV
ncbi:MAG: hypothetical protein ABJB74_11570, partial [Gemmatimonas sp.]